MISTIGQTQIGTAFKARVPENSIRSIKCPAIPDGFVSTSRRVLMNPDELGADVFQSNKNASGQLFSALNTTKTRLEGFRAPFSKYEEVAFRKSATTNIQEAEPKLSSSLREKAREYFENLDASSNGLSGESLDKQYN